ncbi:helix-turn-helix transcriptional regulator [Streptomyces sp. MST-110588]|uniref:helix-turn-helix domain-containing protein n=1 Tax=Streptomyces sp. MST-110588 TaxID=2833628 RepID=UPI001F5D777C|nr:helix-turn-helix transcriptional regulator [Streptomyces sp. MST-110588]UNO39995.1 helix-turn-helix transcriptional regulator [Streptomyces sp. MST-110588]
MEGHEEHHGEGRAESGGGSHRETYRETYRERPSPLGGAPGGAAVWTRTAGPSPRPVLPDGCTDLIWTGGRLLVAGPDTRAHTPDAPPGARFVGLRFAPGQGPAVFGVPAHELRDLRVPLADLWPQARVRRLAEQVAGAAAPGRMLEEIAADRLRAGGAPDPARDVIAAIAVALGDGRTVSQVARSVGMGERRLHRRCLEAFGYGPKTLGRVLRLVRALDLARSGMPYAQVAAVAGYADQAHLSREVKSLTGAPLGALTRPG